MRAVCPVLGVLGLHRTGCVIGTVCERRAQAVRSERRCDVGASRFARARRHQPQWEGAWKARLRKLFPLTPGPATSKAHTTCWRGRPHSARVTRRPTSTSVRLLQYTGLTESWNGNAGIPPKTNVDPPKKSCELKMIGPPKQKNFFFIYN